MTARTCTDIRSAHYRFYDDALYKSTFYLLTFTYLLTYLLTYLQLIYFRTWLATVPSTLSGLNASLFVRDAKTKRLRVNYDPRIREMLHEAEQLMKLNLDIGSLALNLCMDEDRLKTTNDKSALNSSSSAAQMRSTS